MTDKHTPETIPDCWRCRLNAAAPALLEALKGITPLDWSLNDPMSLKYGAARDAIKAANRTGGKTE